MTNVYYVSENEFDVYSEWANIDYRVKINKKEEITKAMEIASAAFEKWCCADDDDEEYNLGYWEVVENALKTEGIPCEFVKENLPLDEDEDL